VSYELWSPAIAADVNTNEVECLGEGEHEDEKQDHECLDLVDHRDEHGDQEVQLSEHSDQVNYFNEGEYNTKCKDYERRVVDLRVHDISGGSDGKQHIPSDLHIVPGVFEVFGAFDPHLVNFIGEEKYLDGWADYLAEVEHPAFLAVSILVGVVNQLHVDVVEHKEDHVEQELLEEVVSGVVIPFVVNNVLNALLIKYFKIFTVFESPRHLDLIFALDQLHVKVPELHLELLFLLQLLLEGGQEEVPLFLFFDWIRFRI